MSEAWGLISIKTTPEIAAKFNDPESIAWEAMVALFKESDLEVDKLIEFGDDPFYHEGIKIDNELIIVSVLGSEWMDAMKPLVNNGSGL